MIIRRYNESAVHPIHDATGVVTHVPGVTLSINTSVLLHAYEAKTFFSRMRGLHAYLPIDDNEALVIRPCKAIHTFGMPSSIDSVFVDAAGLVLDVKTVPVRRWASCSKAVAVVETNAGVCARLGIVPGVVLDRNRGNWV